MGWIMRFKLRLHNSIPSEIIQACNGDRIAAGILCGRGFDTLEKIKAFFLQNYQPVCTSDLKDIDIAVSRIVKAIDNKEKICVYGDYDVDGVTATAILTECLAQIGASCMFHVPDRFSEGYGMNSGVITNIAKKGVKLIVTCDCGISNVEEIRLANELGMEVIVTDHHSIPECLPSALCLINPKLWEDEHPACCAPGAVVAFYLARALFEKHEKMGAEEQFLDLAALAIIADVVPFTNENRYLLKQGLRKISENKRLGLKCLFEIAKADGEIDEEFIGFQIAPRINAAGRLDSARKAVKLLITREEVEAFELAQELDSLNQARKKIETEIVQKAEELITQGHKDRNIFALYDAFWHHGVIGIAAGRLCEKYNKPVILMTAKEDGETVTGSARSPEGVSIYDILNECDSEKFRFGGHDAAAGLSLNIKDVPEFINQVEKVALRHKVEPIKKIDVDMELKLSEIDDFLWNSIRSLAPFGEGFGRPVFISKKVKIALNAPIRDIGRRLVFQNGQDICNGVFWREADYEETPENCEIIYSVNQNVFRSKKELRLNIISIINEEKDSEIEFKPESIKIVDLRDKSEKFKEYLALKNSQIFYEGTDKDLRQSGKSRFEITEANTLVMYSIPPTLEVLRSIIHKAKPQEVVLIFVEEIISQQEFFKKASGLIKFIISKKEGLTSFAELKSLLGQSYECIELLLKYFEASGAIQYESVEDNLVIREGNGKRTKDCERYKKAGSVLIDEAAAFRKYIKNSLKPLLII